MLWLEFFLGVQKRPKEPTVVENEKLALSLELLGTKRILFRGLKGPGDCIYTLFFSLVFHVAKK